MTKKEYEQYQKRVKKELSTLECLNNGTVLCPDCGTWVEGENCPDCGMDFDLMNEPSFSWSSCDCCGSSLGGDKYKAMGLIKNRSPRRKNNWIEYSICVDCMYYIEYGQLDDMTMMEIEG